VRISERVPEEVTIRGCENEWKQISQSGTDTSHEHGSGSSTSQLPAAKRMFDFKHLLINMGNWQSQSISHEKYFEKKVECECCKDKSVLE